MDIFEELIYDIIDDIDLRLTSYEGFIADGIFYNAETKLCESKLRLNEVIDDIEKWTKEVDLFIKRMKKDKFRQNYAIEVRNALYDIEHNGIEKINRNGKSEIESISICGENVLMNDILNNIYYFNENTNNVWLPKIEKYMDDINEYLNSHQVTNAWRELYNALIYERNFITELNQRFIRIKDRFLHRNRR